MTTRSPAARPGVGQRLTVVAAGRGDEALDLRPLATRAVRIDQTTAHLESPCGSVVLVLHPDLGADVFAEQRPLELGGRGEVAAHDRRRGVELGTGERHVACSLPEVRDERPASVGRMTGMPRIAPSSLGLRRRDSCPSPPRPAWSACPSRWAAAGPGPADPDRTLDDGHPSGELSPDREPGSAGSPGFTDNLSIQGDGGVLADDEAGPGDLHARPGQPGGPQRGCAPGQGHRPTHRACIAAGRRHDRRCSAPAPACWPSTTRGSPRPNPSSPSCSLTSPGRRPTARSAPRTHEERQVADWRWSAACRWSGATLSAVTTKSRAGAQGERRPGSGLG